MGWTSVSWAERVAFTAKNALRPGYARVMATKVFARARGDARKTGAAVTWARPLSVPIPEYCEHLDPELWSEAQSFGSSLRASADELGERLGHKLGGGARAELLYFFTRLHRPSTILETGVLHGYSSAAFLHALERNADGGRLFSSDFPYFRERDPEALVGVLVPEHLRRNWTLLLAGDRKNLPALVERSGPIDLFHYDSDKAYSGRSLAMNVIEPHFSNRCVVLMDDIQDNLYFRDWTERRGLMPVVLGTGSYFVGAVNVPVPDR
jgi:predicted O-methyltransferase YrrM